MASKAPVNTQQPETPFKHPGQDESGRTDAPMSEIGRDTLKREGMDDDATTAAAPSAKESTK
jgi:hypothetical protein